ncbi:MAG: DHA2 family efflux MFS transporter permease subunit, partial [Acidobacteria bacterium]|nr:DHA2 family efflux MFS transporter permease subunit [Acidobacteriota bacterium]
AAVTVSLPYIAGNLSSSVDEATWVLTSYLVANAVVLPIAGWLANYMGRKRLLMLAVTIFTIASVLCGMATSLSMLIIFRIIQGAGGGSLQPTTRAILLETFPREERGKAMAFWGMGIVVAPIMAPVLGGWLTTDYTWRLVFFINVPISIAGLILVHLFVHDPSYIKRTSNRIDYWGLGMLVTGIAALQVMFHTGQEDDWFGSHFIVTLAIIAFVFLTAFVIWELTRKDPIVRFRLLKHRTFAVGVTLSAVMGIVLFGSTVLLPLFMQELLGFPAITAGEWNTPRGLATMAFMPLAGILISRRWDMRRMLFFGSLTAAAGLFGFSLLNLNAGPWNFVPPEAIMGLGFSFIFVPLATITVDPIPAEQMGYATSIIALMRNIGGGLGISAVTTLLARREQFHQDRLAVHITSFSLLTAPMLKDLQQRLAQFGVTPTGAGRHSLQLLYDILLKQATVLSYLDAFRALTLLFVLV